MSSLDARVDAIDETLKGFTPGLGARMARVEEDVAKNTLFREEVRADFSALRDWLQGFLGRHELDLRKVQRHTEELRDGHRNMTAVLLEIKAAVIVKENA